MTNSSITKASRLLKIQQLLLEYPEGLTQAELARKLDVHRSTIGRYLTDFLDMGGDFDGAKWIISENTSLYHIQLNYDETQAIHIASRIAYKSLDKHNPHLANAISKIATATKDSFPHVSSLIFNTAEKILGNDKDNNEMVSIP